MAWLKNLNTHRPIPASLLKWLDDDSDTRSVADVINNISQATVNSFYPVGSIYICANGNNPATLFGGTWQKIEGRFLLASGGGYTLGTTGGEASHVLTKAEMPAHDHAQTSTGKATNISSGTGYTTAVTNTYGDTVNYRTGSNGSNAAHNNMPPYLVVNVWKRTA